MTVEQKQYLEAINDSPLNYSEIAVKASTEKLLTSLNRNIVVTGFNIVDTGAITKDAMFFQLAEVFNDKSSGEEMLRRDLSIVEYNQTHKTGLRDEINFHKEVLQNVTDSEGVTTQETIKVGRVALYKHAIQSRPTGLKDVLKDVLLEYIKKLE